MGTNILNRTGKKAQATVEFLLVIAVLVPILIYAVDTINKRVFGTIESWIGLELQSRARYGYSHKYYSDGGLITDSALTNTSGQPPVKYLGSSSTTASDPMHPLSKAREGWKQ